MQDSLQLLINNEVDSISKAITHNKRRHSLVEPQNSLPVDDSLEAANNRVLLMIQLHLDLEPFYGVQYECGCSG